MTMDYFVTIVVDSAAETDGIATITKQVYDKSDPMEALSDFMAVLNPELILTASVRRHDVRPRELSSMDDEEKPITRRAYMTREVLREGATLFLAQEAVSSTALEHPEWDMDELVDPRTGERA